MTDYTHLYKVVTVGNSGVGKTSCLERFIYNKFDEHCPTTIGVEFFVKSMLLKNDKCIKLQVWDLGGQDKFTNIVKSYFRNIDGGILVFDLTNRQTFNDLRNWMERIKESTGSNDDIQFVLVGNKCDLTNFIAVSDEEIRNFVEEYSLNISQFFKTSAKDNVNISTVFNDLANAIYYHYEAKGMKDKGMVGVDLSTIHLGQQTITSSFCCGS